MWSYYGTKKRIAKKYPLPRHTKIIEPFCGAAQYSLFENNWQNDVVISDKYTVVYKLWKWLVEEANEKDILALPDMNAGDKVDDIEWLCEEERYLIGFSINYGSSQPKKTVAKYNSWERARADIANNIYKVKHWQVLNLSYDEIQNEQATWFIDPPYQYGGQWYHSSVNNKKIDFERLACYCRERMGQTIVCENDKADWLPFKPLVEMHGQLHKTMEVIWTNDDVDDTVMSTFF